MPIESYKYIDSPVISLGGEALNTAYSLLLIEANLRTETPHTFIQVLKHFLEITASEYPQRFHYDIAKYALQNLSITHKNTYVIDMFAREIVKACIELNKRISIPIQLTRQIKYVQTDSTQLCSTYLTVVELPNFDESQLFINNITIWDSAYVETISEIGNTGKRIAETIAKELNTSPNWNKDFWFKREISPFYYSPSFLNLATIVWEDVIKKF